LLHCALWLGQTPVSARERNLAIRRIISAHAHGRITATDAGRRQALLEGAHTRQELCAVLDGLSGVRPQWNFAAFTGIAAMLWLVVTVADVTVWSMVCLIGGERDDPWWLWSLIVRGALVVGLWQAAEWEHRALLTDDRSPVEPEDGSSGTRSRKSFV
jgi:hypothetical protein